MVRFTLRHRRADDHGSCRLCPVLLLYDFILTSSVEVDLVWRRKPDAASFIYIISRVAAISFILGNVLIDIENVSLLH